MSSISNNGVAYSHLEIEAAAPGLPLVILFADGDRRVRRPYAALRAADCNHVLLRPAGKGWYHDGVPGLGATIEETAASLRRVVEALQPDRIVTFGASVGGYAAIVFGSLLQADRIVALSAELQLMLPGSRSVKDLTATPRKFADLLPHLQDRSPGSVWLAASESEIVELYGAVRAAALPAVQAVALRNTAHLSVASLEGGEGCVPILEAALNDETMPPIADAGDLLNDRTAVDAAFEAHCLLIEKRGAEAERHAALAVERRVDWPLAQHLLGRVKSLLGRDIDAEAAAGRAAVLDPTQALFLHHHGLTLARLGRHAEAAEAQQAAIDRGFAGPWAYHHLGVARYRSGDHVGAEAAHRAASERRPKSPLFQHHLAIALVALGRLAEAELAARAATELSGENGDYLRQLARILRAQGRKDEAERVLDEAESIDPSGTSPAEVSAEAPQAPQPPVVEIPASVAELLERHQVALAQQLQDRQDEAAAVPQWADATDPPSAPRVDTQAEQPAPDDDTPAKDTPAEPLIDLPASVVEILSRVPRR